MKLRQFYIMLAWIDEAGTWMALGGLEAWDPYAASVMARALYAEPGGRRIDVVPYREATWRDQLRAHQIDYSADRAERQTLERARARRAGGYDGTGRS